MRIVFGETFSISYFGKDGIMMKPIANEILFQKTLEYLYWGLDLNCLEEWLLSNLNEILDSDDKTSIELAKLLEGSIVEIGEGISTKEDLNADLQKIVDQELESNLFVWSTSSSISVQEHLISSTFQDTIHGELHTEVCTA